MTHTATRTELEEEIDHLRAIIKRAGAECGCVLKPRHLFEHPLSFYMRGKPKE